MKDTSRQFGFLLVLFLSVGCHGNDSPVGPEEDYPPPSRILFVGNSLTGFNDGVDTHLEGLVAASDSLPWINAESAWFAGASLRSHWSSDDTKDRIRNGDWDVVVLQEHSRLSITDTENMYTYALLLDELILDGGARTVFFMTWAWRDEPGMIDQLVPGYRGIAGELGAALAPVGLAWERSLSENPDLDLYEEDGIHPDYHGTYLAACVFYALLWKESPEGIPYYGPRSVTPVEGKFLQKIAWETVIDMRTARQVIELRPLPIESTASSCIHRFSPLRAFDHSCRRSTVSKQRGSHSTTGTIVRIPVL